MIKQAHHKGHQDRLLIGAHTSIAGGLQNALYEGASIGCTCIQMFTHSNRQWGMPPLTSDQIDTFEEARTTTGIDDIMVHASYLINAASNNQLIHHKSTTALKDELSRCEALAIPLLVMHPGSAAGQLREAALDQVINTITTALAQVPHQHTLLLLENMAGQGSILGSTLEELSYLYHHLKPHKRIGICIDTCHAYAAGYPIDTPTGYDQFWEQFDALIGISKLKALHLNDSVHARGSHRDRHAHIGKGQIGIAMFKRVMNDPRFAMVPKVIETPRESLQDHAHNLELLRSLAHAR